MTSLKHKFASAKADGSDATVVKPSNWNDEHNFTTAAANVYLGRDQSAPGAVQELIVVPHGAGDDGTIWTADKVRDAIADSIAAIPVVTWVPTGATLGWYSNTLPAGGWIFANGRTMGSTASAASLNGAQYQALFTYLWGALTDAVSQMQTNVGAPTVRGASALLDWNANKRIVIPDECGRAAAGANNMGGVTSRGLLTTAGGGINGDLIGSVGGVQNNMHQHTGNTGTNTPPGGLGVVSGGPAVADHTHPFVTTTVTLPTVQPTIIKNVIIKL